MVLSGVYFLLFLNSFYYCKLKSFSAVCFLPTAKAEHKNLSGGSGAAEAAGLTTLLQISADSCVCSVHSNHQPIGWVFIEPMRGVSTVYLSYLS